MSDPQVRTLAWSRLSSWARSRQFRFLLVGAFNTLVGLAAYALFVHLVGDTVGYVGALVLAYMVGIAVGFVLHRRLVFQVEGNVLVDLVRYIGVQASAFALNAALLPALVELVHVPPLPAQVIALSIVVVTTYLGHARISFHRPRH